MIELALGIFCMVVLMVIGATILLLLLIGKDAEKRPWLYRRRGHCCTVPGAKNPFLEGMNRKKQE